MGIDRDSTAMGQRGLLLMAHPEGVGNLLVDAVIVLGDAVGAATVAETTLPKVAPTRKLRGKTTDVTKATTTKRF